MDLMCKRCGYQWPTKKEVEPKVCPRCKSKLWKDGAKNKYADGKCGKVYVVLLPDNTISVGQTTVGEKRISQYVGVKDYELSSPVKDLNKEERQIIKKATELCGEPKNGREFFNGGSDEFLALKVAVMSIKFTADVDMDSINSFDFKRLACSMAVEKNLPVMRHIEQQRLSERNQFYLATMEAFLDYKNGVCSADIAFHSLIETITSMKNIAKLNIKTSNIDTTMDEYADDINDICS